MRALNLVIFSLWIAFWIYWFIEAGRAKRARTRALTSAGVGVRALVFLVIVLLLRSATFRGQLDASVSPAVQAAGFTLFVLGIGFAVWARVYLGSNWGMPMSEKVDPELVTTGPYRYVRHPIYSGIILAMIGTGIAVSAYWLIPAVILAVYFVFSAAAEERIMLRVFPATYPAYKHASKMLIPFLL